MLETKNSDVYMRVLHEEVTARIEILGGPRRSRKKVGNSYCDVHVRASSRRNPLFQFLDPVLYDDEPIGSIRCGLLGHRFEKEKPIAFRRDVVEPPASPDHVPGVGTVDDPRGCAERRITSFVDRHPHEPSGCRLTAEQFAAVMAPGGLTATINGDRPTLSLDVREWPNDDLHSPRLVRRKSQKMAVR